MNIIEEEDLSFKNKIFRTHIRLKGYVNFWKDQFLQKSDKFFFFIKLKVNCKKF